MKIILLKPEPHNAIKRRIYTEGMLSGLLLFGGVMLLMVGQPEIFLSIIILCWGILRLLVQSGKNYHFVK